MTEPMALTPRLGPRVPRHLAAWWQAVLLALVVGRVCRAADAAADGLTARTREWQAAAVTKLKAFRPTPASPVLDLEQRANRVVRIDGPAGMFWLGSTDWGCFDAFSTHDSEPQVVLLICRDGRIFRTFEHVCPYLFLRLREDGGVDSVERFLRSETCEGGDKRSWELLDATGATPERLELPTALAHMRQVVQSEDARPETRRVALRALFREGSDESWQLVEAHLAGSSDWALLDELRRAAGTADHPRAAAVHRLLDQALGTDPEQRASRLAEAIAAVASRESVGFFTSLVDDPTRAAVCTRLEAVVAGQSQPVDFGSGPFWGLRNSVTALAALDAGRAASCCRALLNAPTPTGRQAGIYGVGELRLADTVDRLLGMVDRDAENSFSPSAVCVALGKIGTREAHDALVKLDPPRKGRGG
jgi:hypothetical protein